MSPRPPTQATGLSALVVPDLSRKPPAYRRSLLSPLRHSRGGEPPRCFRLRIPECQSPCWEHQRQAPTTATLSTRPSTEIPCSSPFPTRSKHNHTNPPQYLSFPRTPRRLGVELNEIWWGDEGSPTWPLLSPAPRKAPGTRCAPRARALPEIEYLLPYAK